MFIQSIASIPQELVEQQLIELLQFVTPSPECEGELLSFLCVEAFSGFCNSNGTVHRTSRPDCERITTTVCAAEFLQLLPLLEARGADLSCDTFPASSTICNCEYNTWHCTTYHIHLHTPTSLTHHIPTWTQHSSSAWSLFVYIIQGLGASHTLLKCVMYSQLDSSTL